MREYIWLRVEMSEIYKNTGIFRWLVPYIFFVVFRWLDTNLGIVFVVWIMEWFSTELWNVIGAHLNSLIECLICFSTGASDSAGVSGGRKPSIAAQIPAACAAAHRPGAQYTHMLSKNN